MGEVMPLSSAAREGEDARENKRIVGLRASSPLRRVYTNERRHQHQRTDSNSKAEAGGTLKQHPSRARARASCSAGKHSADATFFSSPRQRTASKRKKHAHPASQKKQTTRDATNIPQHYILSLPAHLIVLEDVPAAVGLPRVESHDSHEEGVQQRRQEQRHVDLLEEVLVAVLSSCASSSQPQMDREEGRADETTKHRVRQKAGQNQRKGLESPLRM